MKKMKNKFNSKDKFKDITLNSHFLRVDETHPLDLFVGLNDEGQKTIRLRGDYEKANVKSSKIIKVTHFLSGGKLLLSFSLTDHGYEDLFYIFCNDLVDSSSEIENKNGYVFIVNRFDRWRTFGQTKREHLSENEIKGLIGELLLLKEVLFEKYGQSTAISGWTGTEKTKKDFYFNDLWYETKVTTTHSISISSFEQLESNTEGRLVVIRLEKLSPEGKGITLNNLIKSIEKEIELRDDLNEYIFKIYNTKYVYSDYYDNFIYEYKDLNQYKVDKTFPILRREAVPTAIDEVNYTLLLNLIEEHLEE